MKILIVSQYYYPEQFQINEIAPELVKLGHEVTVLTGLPNYPKGEIFEGYNEAYKKEEIIDGVKVIRVKERPRKKGALNLLRNYLSFVINGNRRAKKIRENDDVVVSYQLSPVLSVYPAIKYAKKHGVPLLLYCLDIWPESALAHLSSKKSLIYKFIAKLSKNIYKSCDHIAVTSRPFIDYLYKNNGIDVSKMSYIPQHASEEMLNLDLTAEDNGISDFVYAGNMGAGQNLSVIIAAVAKLKDRKDFIVHMVGDGSYREKLEQQARELGVSDKFVFYGNKKRDEMSEYYKKADALLITLRGNNAVGDTMPGKLQTYMTTGKPILGAINGAAKETIEISDCGKCVAAGDADGLAKIMIEFMDGPERFSDCGERARKYFKNNFTKDIYISSLNKKLCELVKGE